MGDLLERVGEHYGVIGIGVLIIAFCVLFFVWGVLSIMLVWPVFIPIIAAAYMIWSVRE